MRSPSTLPQNRFNQIGPTPHGSITFPQQVDYIPPHSCERYENTGPRSGHIHLKDSREFREVTTKKAAGCFYRCDEIPCIL